MVMNVHNYERYFSFIIDESRRIYVIFFLNTQEYNSEVKPEPLDDDADEFLPS